MEKNLLFLTRKWNKIYSLEIDLDKHVYYFNDEEEKQLIERNKGLNCYFINKDLFNIIFKTFEESSYFIEDGGAGNASNLIIEAGKDFKDEEKLTKEQVYTCLKNGFIGYSEEEMNKILDQMIDHGAEVANYLVEEDILNIYRKYIKYEISNYLFSRYAFFVTRALYFNKRYKNDDVNTMINEIEWGFDGLAFCNCGDDDNNEEMRETDPYFYSYIKSCCYKIQCFLNKKDGRDLEMIKGRYKMYVYRAEWDTFLYIIEDIVENTFNYGHFYLDTYEFNLDYFYDCMEKEEFYSLLESYLFEDDDEEYPTYNKKLTLKAIK